LIFYYFILQKIPGILTIFLTIILTHLQINFCKICNSPIFKYFLANSKDFCQQLQKRKKKFFRSKSRILLFIEKSQFFAFSCKVFVMLTFCTMFTRVRTLGIFFRKFLINTIILKKYFRPNSRGKLAGKH
jgi:hypothetical protein